MSSASGDDPAFDYASDSDSDSDSGSNDGGAVFDLLPSTVESLRSAGGDASAQVACLTAFCDALAFTEYADDLAGLPLDEIVPLIVELLAGSGGSPDVMLISARVLTYLLDLMPRAAHGVLAKHGVVEALCRPLMEIEYLDVAEQVIS